MSADSLPARVRLHKKGRRTPRISGCLLPVSRWSVAAGGTTVTTTSVSRSMLQATAYGVAVREVPRHFVFRDVGGPAVVADVDLVRDLDGDFGVVAGQLAIPRDHRER